MSQLLNTTQQFLFLMMLVFIATTPAIFYLCQGSLQVFQVIGVLVLGVSPNMWRTELLAGGLPCQNAALG